MQYRFTQTILHSLVFSYSWKIQEGCINKVAEKLTINTIRYWLPNLYPTDFQKGEQSLVKLKATIANADGINSGVRALEKNLTSSNATLQQLSKVSDSIQQASHKFDQSTDKITKLKVLYDELKQANENFNSSVTKLVDSALQERECKIVCVNRYCMNLLYAPYWGKQR